VETGEIGVQSEERFMASQLPSVHGLKTTCKKSDSPLPIL